MEAVELARSLSRDGRILEVASGVTSLYRIWDLDDTRLVKVYASGAAHKREKRALDMLSGLSSLPEVLEDGVTDELHYTVFDDPGKWTLETLQDNASLSRTAGALLAELHQHDPAHFSNVAHGMDQDWITSDFPSVFRRLERYRGRLQLKADVLTAAGQMEPPIAESQVIIHTDPGPDHFFVQDGGSMTLLHWEWSTLGPPEWDLSRLVWLMRAKAGPAAAAAVSEGYGAQLAPAELNKWAAYHSAMMLTQLVEHMEQPLKGAKWLVEELEQAVGVSA